MFGHLSPNKSPIKYSGAFFVPMHVPTQQLMLRPPSHNLHESYSFSSQFMDPREMGAHKLFNMSPTAVDPCLTSYVSAQPDTPTRPQQRANKACVSRSPLGNVNKPPRVANSSKQTGGRKYQKRSGRETKRYQYWTSDEDNLVKHLRDSKGWTWKDIAAELERQLGGVHTWQAIQMRYLRNLKTVDPVVRVEESDEVKIEQHDPSMPSLSEIERAVRADWVGRWLRVSAKLGCDVNCYAARDLALNREVSDVLESYVRMD